MENSGKAINKDYKRELPTICLTPKNSSEKSPAVALNSICPSCGYGKMDYNGLLNLECPICHFEYGGGYT